MQCDSFGFDIPLIVVKWPIIALLWQAAETKAQFENYERLFDYINANPDYNAKIQFGTLSEYFNEMRKEIGDVKK